MLKDSGYISNETYFQKLKEHKDIHHWKDGVKRWEYHRIAKDLLRDIHPSSVLEAGTMGIKLHSDSDTIDMSFPELEWELVYKPTYEHDLRVIPYPVEDKKYDVFVGLRVFHRVRRNAKECFKELKRISKKIILALPNEKAKEYAELDKHIPVEIQCKETNTVILYWDFTERKIGNKIIWVFGATAAGKKTYIIDCVKKDKQLPKEVGILGDDILIPVVIQCNPVDIFISRRKSFIHSVYDIVSHSGINYAYLFGVKTHWLIHGQDIDLQEKIVSSMVKKHLLVPSVCLYLKPNVEEYTRRWEDRVKESAPENIYRKAYPQEDKRLQQLNEIFDNVITIEE